MTTYWHGSPNLITDDYVVPGCELGIDNYAMERNRAVFVARRFETAAGMGQPSWNTSRQPKAPYMYEVEPIDVYEDDAPHATLLDDEVMCKRARIVRRFRNVQPTHDEYTRIHGPAFTWANQPHYALLTEATL